jgi:hypothetical protein
MTRTRLTGRITVALPPREAFALFTPRGERAWEEGWEPRFPVAVTDDTEPGTVFETHAHGRYTTWLVIAREPDRLISYARVTPHDRAGTVTVAIGDADGHSEVEVTYVLTPLTDTAEPALREFAAHYPAYLHSWEDAIAAWLRRTLPT